MTEPSTVLATMLCLWIGGDPACKHTMPRNVNRHRPGFDKQSTNTASAPDTWSTCGKCGACREDLQIGLEHTPDVYIQKIVEVFREVRRVLTDAGTLWLNLGDTYSAGKGTNRSSQARRSAYERRYVQNGGTMLIDTRPTGRNHEIIKPKDLAGIPWRVALALQADGWYLRQDIIWHKPNPMPESVTDRCTKAHEYIFLLSKSPTYYYDAEAIREPYAEDQRKAGMREARKYGYDGNSNYEDWYYRQRERTTWHPAGPDLLKHGRATKVPGSFVPNLLHPAGRNKRSVWTVAPKPYRGAHFATFPPDLILPCILAGCPPAGVVLDPFMGSGTTGYVAKKNARHFVGIELNPEYLELARMRIQSIPDTFPLTHQPAERTNE